MDERMDAVEKWAKFVLNNDDMEWSRQQKILIDSQIENAREIKLTREQVDYIKETSKPKH